MWWCVRPCVLRQTAGQHCACRKRTIEVPQQCQPTPHDLSHAGSSPGATIRRSRMAPLGACARQFRTPFGSWQTPTPTTASTAFAGPTTGRCGPRDACPTHVYILECAIPSTRLACSHPHPGRRSSSWTLRLGIAWGTLGATATTTTQTSS